MRPVVLQWLSELIGPGPARLLTAPGWWYMFFLGLLLGWIVTLHSCNKQGISAKKFTYSLAAAAIAAIAGGRIVHVVLEYESYLRNPLGALLFFEGGAVAFGGLIAGVLTFAAVSRRQGLPVLKITDLAAPAIGLGIFTVRIGCFLNGCCWGAPTNLPWGVSYPPKSGPFAQQVLSGLIPIDAPAALPVHPSQLYESLYGLALFFIFKFVVYPRRKFDGQTVLLFAIAYSLCRALLNEPFRADPRGAWLGLYTSQWIAALLSACCLYLYFRLKKKSEHEDDRAAEQRAEVGAAG